MTKPLTLCIYTNCTDFNSGDSSLLANTVNSFDSVFSINDYIEEIFVFLDPNPNTSNLRIYQNSIFEFFNSRRFPTVKFIVTDSLSRGYLNSLNFAKTKYLFQLEHDWEFIQVNIRHNLEDIVKMMYFNNLKYLRFNKRDNIVAGLDFLMEELPVHDSPIKVCKTNNISNNPHIIDRERYISDGIHKMIKLSKLSFGIEEELTKKLAFTGVVYGPKFHPATIRHTDGKIRHIK